MKLKTIPLLTMILLVMGSAGAHPLELHTQPNPYTQEYGTGWEYEFRLTMPFAYFSEGHVLTGSILVVLWASFFYMVYSLLEPAWDAWKGRKHRKK